MNTTNSPATAAPETLLRFPDVAKRCGLARSTIFLAIKNGTFPAPVNLGPRSVAWPESQISAWIAEKIAAAPSRTGGAL